MKKQSSVPQQQQNKQKIDPLTCLNLVILLWVGNLLLKVSMVHSSTIDRFSFVQNNLSSPMTSYPQLYSSESKPLFHLARELLKCPSSTLKRMQQIWVMNAFIPSFTFAQFFSSFSCSSPIQSNSRFNTPPFLQSLI